MIEIISIMFLGIGTGYLFRKHQRPNTLRTIINVLIWTLLLLLGIEAGSNPKIISSVSTLGIEALVITLAAVLGSCFTASLLWHMISKNRKQEKQP